MPISKQEFEKGRLVTDPREILLNFFKRNPDKAYDLRELAEVLGYALGEDFMADLLTLMAVSEILKALIDEKSVIKRQIGFVEYYTLRS